MTASGFATQAFLTGLPLTLASVVALFTGGWLLSRVLGRVNVVDTFWGLGFALIAVVAFAWTHDDGANATRRALVLALTLVWSLRLSAYIGWRSRGAGEDPRYAAMLRAAAGSKSRWAFWHIFVLQAVVAWFVSLPVQVALAERAGPNALTWLGAALWATGMGFEAIGDAQMAAFKRDPDNRGQVMDSGLWRYTRHPNYFGDACLWTGLWLIAAQQWPGLLTIVSPAAMVWFLAFKTGKPLLEASMVRTKPGYADYVRRTSGFFPLPPRRS